MIISTNSGVSEYHLVLGELMTDATWMRKFVNDHPDYKHDSVISESITYDLMKKLKDISDGTVVCPELTGRMKSMASLKRLPCPEPSVKKDNQE